MFFLACLTEINNNIEQFDVCYCNANYYYAHVHKIIVSHQNNRTTLFRPHNSKIYIICKI